MCVCVRVCVLTRPQPQREGASPRWTSCVRVCVRRARTTAGSHAFKKRQWRPVFSLSLSLSLSTPRRRSLPTASPFVPADRPRRLTYAHTPGPLHTRTLSTLSLAGPALANGLQRPARRGRRRQKGGQEGRRRLQWCAERERERAATRCFACEGMGRVGHRAPVCRGRGREAPPAAPGNRAPPGFGHPPHAGPLASTCPLIPTRARPPPPSSSQKKRHRVPQVPGPAHPEEPHGRPGHRRQG